LFLSGRKFPHSTIITDVSSNTAALEVSLDPDLYLDCFCPVDLSELTTADSSKTSTYISDPIPARGFSRGFLLRNFNPQYVYAELTIKLTLTFP